MRQISVSTDVFAAIWAKRMGNENDEDAILRRLLGAESQSDHQPPAPPASQIGYQDLRNGVTFPRNFKIFRNYKGKRYEAVAENGQWKRQDNGIAYQSLNQLNSSIAAGAENVWNGNWRFIDDDGIEKSIDYLRNR